MEQALSVGLACPQELIGKTDFDIVISEEAQRLRQLDEQVMQSGETYISEEAVILKGQNKVFISKKAPLRNNDGDVIGVIGTSIDITEQKKIEASLREAMQRAEIANQAKNEFIANMSHDLRTPLSGIQALSETIRAQAGQNPELTYNADLLLTASADLLQLVDSIMDVVRIDANSPESQRVSEFRLHPLITNSINIIMPKVYEKQLNFELHYDKQIPVVLIGHSLMLQRIVMNLLSNALKFTERHGRVDFTISIDSRDDEQCTLNFEIKDTGIGIPESKMDMIFEKFSRLTESFKGQYKGTGVGLYLVKQYIDRMGGLIRVSSVENQGTTFSCQIPFKIGQSTVHIIQPTLVAETKPVSSPKTFVEKCHILLVEDNVIAQHSQVAKFKSLGCQVTVAPTAQEAHDLFKKEKFDLLVLDLGLPDLDGWSLARRFRVDRTNPNSLLPIVILTAHAKPEEVIDDQVNVSGVIFRRKPLLLGDAEQLIQEYAV